MSVKKKQMAVWILLLFMGTSLFPITTLVASSSKYLGDMTSVAMDMTPPHVKMTKPQKGWWYLFSWQRKSPISDIILIIGKINVTVNATDNESGMNRVEFYVDNILRWSDSTEPYFWIWSEKKSFSTYILSVVAYNNAGDKNSETLKVWKVR